MRIYFAAALTCVLSWPTASEAAPITREVCRDLVRYEDAGAVAYRPGVDARGRRVVGADAGGQAGFRPLPIAVDISILLPKRILVPADSELQSEVPVSRFVVHEDGAMTFAGQRLAPIEQQAIGDVCRRIYGVSEQ